MEFVPEQAVSQRRCISFSHALSSPCPILTLDTGYENSSRVFGDKGCVCGFAIHLSSTTHVLSAGTILTCYRGCMPMAQSTLPLRTRRSGRSRWVLISLFLLLLMLQLQIAFPIKAVSLNNSNSVPPRPGECVYMTNNAYHGISSRFPSPSRIKVTGAWILVAWNGM